MANPFYVELGFTGVEIASVSKVMGLVATILGIFVGGAMVARYGILWALVVGGVLQAATNLLFALQAVVGHDLGMLAVTIGAETSPAASVRLPSSPTSPASATTPLPAPSTPCSPR